MRRTERDRRPVDAVPLFFTGLRRRVDRLSRRISYVFDESKLGHLQILIMAHPLSTQLLGTWLLTNRIDRTRSGERRVEATLGDDPVALLHYDDSGHFAAQFMKRDRSPASAAAEPVSSTVVTNNSRAQGGYDAYFGTYAVDDVRGTVTQRLMGALSAENVGQVLTREMRVDGDVLTIELDTVSADGEPVTRTLTWQRARRVQPNEA
jgi:hypothetical protein